ncbi:CDP-alcohol phosphatidyltransferase family protein [Lentisphaerota bacterium WC36G]|nr:CDP-alcohol phosphatidyltransferase family protein [Lentisphaerae bacterium WC36]
MEKKSKVKKVKKINELLKFVPNTLTLCNSLCGFTAILWCLGVYGKSSENNSFNYLAIAAVIILLAMIFDALDGFAARLFNATSMHGMQMDSLADMVTFGVAPSVLVAILAHRLNEINHLQELPVLFIWFGCAMYLGCAALRLATYNVHALQEKKSSDTFYGLPSPGAASAVCIAVIFLVHDYSDNLVELANKLTYTMPFYAGVLGLLMTSKIKYIHVGKYLANLKRNKVQMILVFVILALIIYKPVITLLIVINLYICSGPVMVLFNSLLRSDKKCSV